jgi:hypothetical protein
MGRKSGIGNSDAVCCCARQVQLRLWRLQPHLRLPSELVRSSVVSITTRGFRTII